MEVAVIPKMPIDVLLGIKDFSPGGSFLDKAGCSHNLMVLTRTQRRLQTGQKRDHSDTTSLPVALTSYTHTQ